MSLIFSIAISKIGTSTSGSLAISRTSFKGNSSTFSSIVSSSLTTAASSISSLASGSLAISSRISVGNSITSLSIGGPPSS